MKVYLLKPDTTYRMMYPEDDVYESDNWEFKCEDLVDRLPQFQAYFDKNLDKPLPDIAYIGMSTFALRHDVATELVDILESSSELLPFYLDDELWYLLNVKDCVDALDEENSKYKINDGKLKLHLTEYAFHSDKLKNKSLFKIPNDNRSQIYCVDDRNSDESILNNLFCAIQAHGYTGVVFKEIYEG